MLNPEAFGRGGVAATAEGQARLGLVVLFGLFWFFKHMNHQRAMRLNALRTDGRALNGLLG